MAENMGKLSQEQLRKLAGVISEAKELTTTQAEIIEKVIASEVDLGKLKISYLKEYFDIYSKSLDQIARKQNKVNDALLILSKTAAENAQRANFGGDNNGSGGSANGGTSDNKDSASDDLAELRKRNDTVKNLLDDEKRKRLDSEQEVAEEKEQQAKRVADFIEQQIKLYRGNLEELDNEIEELYGGMSIYEEQRRAKREQNQKQLTDQEIALEKSLIALHNLRHQDEIDRADQVTAVRLASIQKVTSAEIDAQKFLNNIEAELAYAGKSQTLGVGEKGQEISESGAGLAKEVFSKDTIKAAKAMEDDIAKYKAKRELELKRKNNGILSKEDATRLQKEIADKFKLESLNDEKLIAKRAKLEAGQALKQEIKDDLNTLKTGTFEERKEALKNLTHDADGTANVGKAVSAAIYAISDLAKQLEAKIDEIAAYKGAIDTRLQGSKNEKYAGSYWDQLVRDMTSVGAVNPYFKQETFANNIQTLVNKGIAFDLKQRAFLMTISEKIATTFDAADGTLLRLIRIQQQDSTAGRLGMESALNSFLNEMYETSEYLSDVANGVRNSLEEMQALMEGAEATEVEYQVQKWLGSLYSVGMSQNAVQGISQALGQIAAGQIEGLTSGGSGNLLIMAANDAGLSIADILTDGISANDTNKLLQAAVNYLAELSESAKDNKVVQQQLADVFGVRASDLRAATNLVIPGTTNSIYSSNLAYGNMLSQLSKMAGSMGKRTSIAEMMTNLWKNGEYTLAGSMASNPVSYFIYKMATLVDNATGGIDLPFLNVMGYGIDLNTTVSDLMRIAAVGSGILGSIGPMISGLGSSFSGVAMLNKLGIGTGSGLAVTPRGGSWSGNVGAAGGEVSQSGYVGNASGNDIKNSTIQESEDSKKQQMIEAKEEEEANKVDILNTTVVKIYELLEAVAKGETSFKVKVEGYGLTGSNTKALGGVNGLDATSLSNNTTNLNNGSVNTGGVGGSVDIGGWVMQT